jgi:hypothetical protein
MKHIWFTGKFSIFSKKFEFSVLNFGQKFKVLLIHKVQIGLNFPRMSNTMYMIY